MNTNYPLISIIIPVYNVEKYLERCILSVLNQTYTNLEIIFINDGSKDNSLQILNHYKQIDNRIIILDQANKGVSSARNAGIKIAKGEYISYIDSDDYVSNDYIEYLYNLLDKNNADISCCSYKKTSEDSFVPLENDNYYICTGHNACERLLGNEYDLYVVVWGKLYKSSICKKYPFPEGKVFEDDYNSCRYYYTANEVVVGFKECYAYFHNPNSIMNTQGANFSRDELWAIEERAKFFIEKNELELAKEAVSKIYIYLMIHYKKSKDNTVKNCLTIFKKRYLFTKYLSTKHKIKFIVFYVFPFLFR